MKPEELLAVRAAHLARANPEAYRLFMEAVQAYYAKTVQLCINSPLESLPNAQGRAQAIAHIGETLADCISTADKLEGKSK